MSQARVNDLLKKHEKLQKELDGAKKKLEQQKQATAKKESELNRVGADLVSALLVENDLSIKELPGVLAKHKKAVPFSSDNQSINTQSSSQSTEVGGV
jgi:predicted transcriptional regulator